MLLGLRLKSWLPGCLIQVVANLEMFLSVFFFSFNISQESAISTLKPLKFLSHEDIPHLQNKTKDMKNRNKKHSENADTSTSVTFDMWCWPYDKVKNAEVM